ncbi:hypothetical protein Dda_1655 [Drechslerella dactyloides]|uniref:Uncharacterized protein n=1 Tax=Drechslerella dactyloides TaxID=74499 RepID=A0AAD6NKU3_DREDA|nr:hypothetical protein Dda_1655 [Drechslerella dactyloides]
MLLSELLLMAAAASGLASALAVWPARDREGGRAEIAQPEYIRIKHNNSHYLNNTPVSSTSTIPAAETKMKKFRRTIKGDVLVLPITSVPTTAVSSPVPSSPPSPMPANLNPLTLSSVVPLPTFTTAPTHMVAPGISAPPDASMPDVSGSSYPVTASQANGTSTRYTTVYIDSETSTTYVYTTVSVPPPRLVKPDHTGKLHGNESTVRHNVPPTYTVTRTFVLITDDPQNIEYAGPMTTTTETWTRGSKGPTAGPTPEAVDHTSDDADQTPEIKDKTWEAANESPEEKNKDSDVENHAAEETPSKEQTPIETTPIWRDPNRFKNLIEKSHLQEDSYIYIANENISSMDATAKSDLRKSMSEANDYFHSLQIAHRNDNIDCFVPPRSAAEGTRKPDPLIYCDPKIRFGVRLNNLKDKGLVVDCATVSRFGIWFGQAVSGGIPTDKLRGTGFSHSPKEYVQYPSMPPDSAENRPWRTVGQVFGVRDPDFVVYITREIECKTNRYGSPSLDGTIQPDLSEDHWINITKDIDPGAGKNRSPQE